MPIAIITGSGTYALPGFEVAEAVPVTAVRERHVSRGEFAGEEVLHVSRHGPGTCGCPTTSPIAPTSGRCASWGRPR